ncbi:MAG: anti-sigma F factor [Clostridia bacterium]|nr:anti-sigma F factor [Clostridia bacterium]
MKKTINEMIVKLKANSVNERFARAMVASFCVQAEPSLDEITDIKTAVSEAVTNSVVHAYPKSSGWIEIEAKLYDDKIEIVVSDNGVGIKDISKALEPFYTTKPLEERSGMGFTVMESFMDEMDVSENMGGGLKVRLVKIFEKKSKLAVGE